MNRCFSARTAVRRGSRFSPSRKRGRIRLSLIAAVCLFPFLFPCALAENAPAASSAAPVAEEAVSPSPAKAYVLVIPASQMGFFLPLPEEEDYLFPLTQTLPDGTETENIIHLSPDGVWMESSDCENQDCILEGAVTLENRKDRILGNMIICLPHQLTLQLLTPEEILSAMADLSAPEAP